VSAVLRGPFLSSEADNAYTFLAGVEVKFTQRTIDVKIELLQEVQLRRAVF
jgi:hypothetical protein